MKAMIDEYELNQAIQYVATAPNRSEACDRYEEHQGLLKEWRILYADESDSGPYPLRRHHFSKKGFVSTLFRGNTLWILDSDVVTNHSVQAFYIGYGTYVDSNVASYISALAYRPDPSENLLTFCQELTQSIPAEELARVNPYLYLWESQSHRSSESLNGMRQTMAALNYLEKFPGPLDAEWGRRYRADYQQESEAKADLFLADFFQNIEQGLEKELSAMVDILELILLRTKVIELSSNRSSQNKILELVQFMDEDVSTLMFRELMICCDILSKENSTQMARKLHSLQSKKSPLELVRNCAQDLYFLRAMDMLTNSTRDQYGVDFYMANLITYDEDVKDIICHTELRAIAIHRHSSAAFPIYEQSIPELLEQRLGEKRFTVLAGIFSPEGFARRAKNRSRHHIGQLLINERSTLMALIAEKKSATVRRKAAVN